MTRDVAKGKAILGPDANLVLGYLTRPETLPDVLEGVEKAFFTANLGPHLAQLGGGFFDAAKAAGVHHVVAVSSGTVAIDPPVAVGRWHLAMEERLRETGLPWTMLRPGYFASTTLRWAQTIRGQSAVFTPHGDWTSAPIDPRDVAGVAFEALAGRGHEARRYALTGPERITLREQVEKIGEAIGRTVRCVEIGEDKAKAGMLTEGTPELMADATLELMRAGTSSGLDQVTTTVQEITGRKARSYDDWVRENVAAFA
jgi:uncharacterized protein YbjT (DUF2867 family)